MADKVSLNRGTISVSSHVGFELITCSYKPKALFIVMAKLLTAFWIMKKMLLEKKQKKTFVQKVALSLNLMLFLTVWARTYTIIFNFIEVSILGTV